MQVRTAPHILRAVAFLWAACLVCIPAYGKYGGGSGAAEAPYEIATAEDLMLLGISPEDYDKHFILTADIDLDPNLPGRKVFDKAVVGPWANFSGVFDGRGHTISHLTIAGGGYLGLFGALSFGASVSNLGLEAVDVNGTGDCIGGLAASNGGRVTMSYSTGTVRGDESVGGLVGYNWVGTITHCFSTGAIDGILQVGGLVGHSNHGRIINCYSTGSVAGETAVGGLIGGSWGASVTDCHATGRVIGVNKAGGLVGRYQPYNYSPKVRTSFWDIETTGQATSDGGYGKSTADMQNPNTIIAAGWAFFSGGDGTPDDPYLVSSVKQLNSIGYNPRLMGSHFQLTNDMDLTGTGFFLIGSELFPFTGVFDGGGRTISNLTHSSADRDHVGFFRYVAGREARIENVGLVAPSIHGGEGDHVGALVGRLKNGTLSGCHVDGGIVTGRDRIGGLVGCSRYGTVVNCHSRVTVSGDRTIGGLVGDCHGATIENCHASGDVKSRDDEAGGLVGYSLSGVITKCYATSAVRGNDGVGGLVGITSSDIADCYCTGAVVGYRDVGGLVGGNLGVITDCYSTGRVTGYPGRDDVGGLAGANGSGSIQASFWDADASGQGTSAGGTAQRTAEMQTAGTYLAAGWDFVDKTENGTEDIWWILEGQDYPHLWREAEEQ